MESLQNKDEMKVVTHLFWESHLKSWKELEWKNGNWISRLFPISSQSFTSRGIFVEFHLNFLNCHSIEISVRGLEAFSWNIKSKDMNKDAIFVHLVTFCLLSYEEKKLKLLIVWATENCSFKGETKCFTSLSLSLVGYRIMHYYWKLNKT